MMLVLPWKDGPASIPVAALAHLLFWSIWISTLAVTLQLRRHVLRRLEDRGPMAIRATVEVSLALAFAFTAGLASHSAVVALFGPPPVPEGMEAFVRPVLVLRGVIFYVLAHLAFAALRGHALRRDQDRAQREREVLEAHLAKAQLQVLRAQVQPHCLFNSLHGISGLILEGETDRAHACVVALGSLLRRTFRHDDEPAVPAAEEIALIEDYLYLEKVRLGDRLAYSCRVEPSARGVFVPTLLLLPIVENAVRHGIGARLTGGRVEVSARLDEGDLELAVLDDGVGVSGASSGGPGHGIGLQNCRARLERLYGNRARVEVAPVPSGGTMVVIRLPAEATSNSAPEVVAGEPIQVST